MKYDLAFSFAGEKREDVEAVASHLASRWHVRVFYDYWEVTPGERLVPKLEAVYAQESPFVVIFWSKDYEGKQWPEFESHIIDSRLLDHQETGIIPVLLDSTELPPKLRSIAYIDGRNLSQARIAARIASVLGRAAYFGKASDEPSPQCIHSSGEVEFDYSSYNGCYRIGQRDLEFETKWSKASDTSVHLVNDPESIHGIGNRHRMHGHWTSPSFGWTRFHVSRSHSSLGRGSRTPKLERFLCCDSYLGNWRQHTGR